MLHAFVRTSLVVSALVLVAMTSLATTTHSTPDRQEFERAQLLLAYNATLADLCLSGESEHGRDCPLCHKLPDGPRIDFPTSTQRVAWSLDPKSGGDLVSGSPGYRYQAAPRAPPTSI
ncbi:MAG: hypothetical protein QNJ35_17130 [Paracoccaceae bacterium]|nr:hypothetical protein [Paracoccaceae bacterium]